MTPSRKFGRLNNEQAMQRSRGSAFPGRLPCRAHRLGPPMMWPLKFGARYWVRHWSIIVGIVAGALVLPAAWHDVVAWRDAAEQQRQESTPVIAQSSVLVSARPDEVIIHVKGERLRGDECEYRGAAAYTLAAGRAPKLPNVERMGLLGAEVVPVEAKSNESALGALEGHHAKRPIALLYERYALAATAGSAFAQAHAVPHVLEVNAPLAEEEARHRGGALDADVRAREARLHPLGAA